MKLIVATILTTAILNFTSFACAQDPSTASLRWQIEQNETYNDNNFVYQCAFETTPSTVRWVQKKGSIVSAYIVTGIDGNWPDITQEGSLTFNLERNGRPVRMTVLYRDGLREISLEFTDAGSAVKRTFHVTAVN